MLESLQNSLINAGAGLGGSLISGALSAISNAQQFEYSKEMAKLQNELNMQAWKIQQDYNTPLNQMKRIEEAGLSPNLLYGSVNTGNANSAPTLVAPQRKAADLSEAFNMGMRISQTLAQERLTSAQARSVELSNRDEEARQEGFSRNNLSNYGDKRLDGTLAGYYDFLSKLQLRNTEESFNLNQARTFLTRTEDAVKSIEFRISSATEEDKINLVRSLRSLREVENAIKSIILENNQQLQDFNQKSPELMFWVRIAQMIAGSAASIIQ